MANIHNILLVGETGAGKSSLANRIVGIEDAFEVSDDPEACSKNTIRKISNIDPNISVIDTPGLQDSRGRDKIHYDQMVKIIKEMKFLHFILIVLNFHNPRLTSSIQYMIKFLCNVFPVNFLNHVGVVFTHYDHEYEMKRNKRKDKDPRDKAKTRYIPEVVKIIKDNNKQANGQIEKIPVYFMDNLLDEDANSQEELNQLMALAKMLNPIEDINGNSNLKIKKEIPEIDIRSESKTLGDYIVTNINKYERKKLIDYNDNVTYTDWKLIKTETHSRPIPIRTRYIEIERRKLDDDDESNNAIHNFVKCDGCGMCPIKGDRYKCSVCDNFDYCSACEKKNKDKHNHPFLKIYKPLEKEKKDKNDNSDDKQVKKDDPCLIF